MENIDKNNDTNDIFELVKQLSNNFTKIVTRDELRNYKKLDWGDNGAGDRWANKKFNYTVIYSTGKYKTYSENDNDEIDKKILEKFLDENNNKKGIIGMFVHSRRTNIVKRPIRKDIDNEIKKYNCVSCGSRNDIICDHKNDLYNDELVLSINTQHITDFQPLCNHCNLQKRQICKDEVKNSKIYSAKNLQKYKIYPFEFPWEKNNFDVKCKTTKIDTYWYDPIEFNNKLLLYTLYKYPIVCEVKSKISKGILIKFP